MPTVWILIRTSSGPMAWSSSMSRIASSPFLSRTRARMMVPPSGFFLDDAVEEAAENSDEQQRRQREQNDGRVEDAPRHVAAELRQLGGNDRQRLGVRRGQHQRDQELVPDQHEAEG